ncbi:MAG: DsbA family protein [Nitrospira sp.]|nr:MAG: DsbA family protein [Nitrospira sp.]
MMHTGQSGLRSAIYLGGALIESNGDWCRVLRKSRNGSIPPQLSRRIPSVSTWTDQPDRIDKELMPKQIVTGWRAMMKMTLAALVLCAALLSSPAFGQSTAPTTDPPWRQSVEQVIESYIRSHPEMIEQTLQALAAKRQEKEQASVKQAIVAHQSELLHDPASPVSGDLAGDVTVIEFFDYRCGFCKRAAGSVTQLQKDDARVRIVYKDFPILGDASVQVAKAALASRTQGRHQAFHEALLAAKGDLSKEHVLQIASDVGLDAKRLEVDMEEPEWLTIIERNRELANDLRVTGTPAFVVGNEVVPGAVDLPALKALVARARTRAPH